MIRPPERGAERDAAIQAMLPHVPFDGWSRRALARGLADLGAPADEADLLFPGGAVAMVEAFCDLADRWMAEGVAALDQAGELAGKGLTAQVRAVVKRCAWRRIVRIGRRCAVPSRCWHCRCTHARQRLARRARWTRSGTPPATVLPISPGTPSARCWRRSTARRCMSGLRDGRGDGGGKQVSGTTPRRAGVPGSPAGRDRGGSASCAVVPRRRCAGWRRRCAEPRDRRLPVGDGGCLAVVS